MRNTFNTGDGLTVTPKHYPSPVIKYLPVAMVALLVALELAWNAHTGISWRGPDNATIALIVAPFGAISLYARLRDAPRLSEASLFLVLYILYPICGVRLAYLLTTLDLPLADAALQHFDTAMHFNWLAYYTAINAHSFLEHILFAAYSSPVFQAMSSAIIFSYVRNDVRNYEQLFILAFALLITLVLWGLLPATGPARIAGIETDIAQTVDDLRAGHLNALPYLGIVFFPSYHTIMAIVFTYGHRGMRTFWPYAALNALMLPGIMPFGTHYLADMAGGTAVAALSIAVGRRLYPHPAAIHPQDVPQLQPA